MIGATTLDEYRKHIEKDCRPGAPFPAGAGRATLGGGHHRDPPWAEGAVRGPPRRADHRRRPGGGGRALRPLHHIQVPPRQGDRPGRRGGLPSPHRDRLDARGDRRVDAAHHPARRSRRQPSRRSPTAPRWSGWRRSRRSWPTWRSRSSGSKRTGPWRRRQSPRFAPPKEQMEQAKAEAESAEREGDLEQAAELRYGRLRELDRTLADQEARSESCKPRCECSPKKSPRRTSPRW